MASTPHSYQVINSPHLPAFSVLNLTSSLDLLRIIRMGRTVKAKVDDAIDQCATVYNIRDAIEDARARAEQSTEEQQKRAHAQKGMTTNNSPKVYDPTTLQACRISGVTSN